MAQEISEMRLDKTKLSLFNSFDNSDEKEYWLSQSPQERLKHIERLRRINYGDSAAKGLQRVLEIVKCEWS
jgi:hypothetical protein